MSIKRAVAAAAAAALAIGLLSCGGAKTASAKPDSGDGFAVATGPEAELDDIKSDMNKNLIPSEIGTGSSNRENIALEKAEDDARTKLAGFMSTYVGRLSEDHAQDVNGKADEIWERASKRLADATVSGATAFKKVKLFNKESGQYKYYVLLYISPEMVRKVFSEELEKDKEIELRVKKEEMMSKLDAAIELKNQKYGR